jgi:hypothetical protein
MADSARPAGLSPSDSETVCSNADRPRDQSEDATALFGAKGSGGFDARDLPRRHIAGDQRNQRHGSSGATKYARIAGRDGVQLSFVHGSARTQPPAQRDERPEDH